MMKKITMIIAAIMIAVSAHAQEKRWAVVDLSTVYMRAQPDYESALETQELMGTVVEIVGEKGYWREIVSPQPYRAWVTEKGLMEMSDAELEAYRQARRSCSPIFTVMSIPGHPSKPRQSATLLEVTS